MKGVYPWDSAHALSDPSTEVTAAMVRGSRSDVDLSEISSQSRIAVDGRWIIPNATDHNDSERSHGDLPNATNVNVRNLGGVDVQTSAGKSLGLEGLSRGKRRRYGVPYLKGCFRPSVISAYDTWF